MVTSKAQLMAVKKYRSEKRDQISFDVPKGKRDEFKQLANLLGMSLQGLFVNAVEAYGRNHGSENALSISSEESERFSPADRKLVEEFNQLPVDTQKAVVKLIQTINATKRAD